MTSSRIPLLLLICAVFVLFSGPSTADGQLRWPSSRKEAIEVRLIALAVVYPRSSFFANDEVFVAEQELAKSESRFIKLVYDFLPYQSPLSAYGLDYALVHHFNAVRDTNCDENLWEMRTLAEQDKESAAIKAHWKYAVASPIYDLDRRQARLRCYRATSEDYERAQREPTNQIPY